MPNQFSFVSLSMQRITIEEIRKDPWFPVNYIPARQGVEEEVNLDDIRAAFDDIEVRFSPLPSLFPLLRPLSYLFIYLFIIPTKFPKYTRTLFFQKFTKCPNF